MSEVLRQWAMHCADLCPKETTWLAARDIHPFALGWGGEQFAIKSATVRWEGEHWFDFAAEHTGGKRAAIIVCLDAHSQPQDLAAWSPAEDRLGLRWGHAALIGEEQLSLPRLEGDKLWVHPSPAEWLSHRRAGVVIVNYDRARGLLAGCSPLAVKTIKHKDALEARWRMPRIQVFDVGVAEAIAS